MQKTEFNLDSDSWPNNFGITNDRATELMVLAKKHLMDLALTDKYSPVNFVSDLLNLAADNDEQAWLTFFAGQKVAEYIENRKTYAETYDFINPGRHHEQEAGLAEMLFGGAMRRGR